MVCKTWSTSKNHSTTAELKQSLHIRPLIPQSLHRFNPTGSIRGIKSTETDSTGTLRYKVHSGQSIEYNRRQIWFRLSKLCGRAQVNEGNQQVIFQTRQEWGLVRYRIPLWFLAHTLAVMHWKLCNSAKQVVLLRLSKFKRQANKQSLQIHTYVPSHSKWRTSGWKTIQAQHYFRSQPNIY